MVACCDTARELRSVLRVVAAPEGVGRSGRSKTALSVQTVTGRVGGDVERPRENGSWQEMKPNPREKIGLIPV